MSVLYHLGKSNVVVDALSQISMSSLAHVVDGKKELVKDVHILAWLDVQLEDSLKAGFIFHHNIESYLVAEVKYKQNLDPLLMELKEFILSQYNESLANWRV